MNERMDRQSKIIPLGENRVIFVRLIVNMSLHLFFHPHPLRASERLVVPQGDAESLRGSQGVSEGKTVYSRARA